jgi:hypothetical protein
MDRAFACIQLTSEGLNIEFLFVDFVFLEPFVPERIEPVFDHVFVSIGHDFGDQRPLGAVFLVEIEQLNVFVDAPFALFDGWIEMIYPPLSAFMRRSQQSLIYKHAI